MLRHRSARATCLLLSALGVSGCGSKPAADLRQELRLHSFASCPLAPDASLELVALGNFGAGPDTAEALPVNGRTELGIPLATRAVSVQASAPGDAWWGTAAVDPNGDIDVALWPQRASCVVGGLDGYPLPTGGEALGTHPELGLLLVAGGLSSGPAAARALLLDLRVGDLREVEGGMVPARAFASVSAFGRDLLVAGGVDPRAGDDPDRALPLASASVLNTDSRSFLRGEEIPISPRAEHAAVVLNSGDSLLVAGVGQQGTPLDTLELVSPTERAARIVGLAQLHARRRQPQALVLDDGRVFVGGGQGGDGQRVGLVEWLAADAAQHLGSLELEVSPEVSFAPLTGGGVLAVGACLPEQTGCDPSRAGLWLDAERRATPVAPLSGDVTAPALLPATRGAPLLVLGAPRRLLQFSPWESSFQTALSSPAAGRLPAATEAAAIAAEPGLLVWLEREPAPALVGFRHDVRGVFSRDIGPQLLGLPGLGEALVPNRPPGAAVRFGEAGLELAGDGAVLAADTRYTDVLVVLDLRAGPAPRVALGESVLGGGECPWPATVSPLELRREGRRVTLKSGDGQSRRCEVADDAARRLAVLGPEVAGRANLRSVSVTRLP